MEELLRAALRGGLESYDGATGVVFFRDHYYVPAVSIATYLLLIFVILPRIRWSKSPRWVKHAFALWNLILSLLSIAGGCVILPFSYFLVKKYSLQDLLCSDELMVSSNRDAACWGAVGFVVVLFCLSKVPELCDTFFLVLMGKPVQFLHWYHHVTVMLYCWFNLANAIPSGIVFIAFNLVVHSVMYLYFASSVYTKALSFLRQPITTMQLGQMVLGLTTIVLVFLYGHNYIGSGKGCSSAYVDTGFFYYCTAMYASYFVLFAVLYYQNYYTKKSRRQVATTKEHTQ